MSRTALHGRRSEPVPPGSPAPSDFDRRAIAPAVQRALRELLARYGVTSPDGLPAVIAVTSVLPDPQVGSIARALAVLLSEEHRRSVCWFDARETPSDEAGGQASTASVNDRSDGRRSTDQLVTVTPRLRAVTLDRSRTVHDRSPGDGAMEDRLRSLTRDHDHVVVVAAPPTPGASRASIVRHCDGYILVVRQSAATIVQTQLVIDATGTSSNLGVLMTDYRSSVPRRWRTILDH